MGAELCFLTMSTEVPQFFLPTCNLMTTELVSLEVQDSIYSLLVHYDDLFTEPNTLPPPRMTFDHKIPLKEGSQPFHLRPYRYSVIHKKLSGQIGFPNAEPGHNST